MNRRLVWLIGIALIACGLLRPYFAHAQNADDGYAAQPDDTVTALVVQPDGKAIVGGWFTSINGQLCRYVCRLNADGSIDNTFADVNANDWIYALALQPDGKLLIGGLFSTLGPASAAHHALARLNADGTVDSNFADQGISQYVYSILVQADGQIVAGGNFSVTDSLLQTHQFLARFNSTDGSIDAAFNPQADNVIFALAQQPNNALLVGGMFTSLGGHAHAALALLNLDGTDVTSFDAGLAVPAGVPGVFALALQADAKILVGGSFTSAGGQAHANIARLNVDASVDATFSGSSGVVRSIAQQAGGQLLVGGAGVVRLNVDGTTDTAYVLGGNPISGVYGVAIQPDGKALVGGAFTTASRNFLARFNSDGSLDGTLANANAPDQVEAIAVQPDNRMLVGDCINPSAGDHCPTITRLLADGSVDSGFVETTGFGFDLSALTLQSDGRVLQGGDLSTVNAGQPGENLYRFNTDGSVDASFSGALTERPTRSIAMQADGKVLVAGYFTTAGGLTRHYLVRLNTDGSVDTGFADPNADCDIYTIALQPDGKILAGGCFTIIGSQRRGLIARLNSDGTLDTGFTGPALSHNNVTAIALQPDGKILIAGDFVGPNGLFLARLNADGSLDPGFVDPNLDSNLYSVTLQADGKILIGGVFRNIGTPQQAQRGLARLNSDGSVDGTFANPNPQGGFAFVISIAQQSDGRILAGGSFTQIGAPTPQPRQNFARLSVPDAALQALSVSPTGSSVTWMRSGTSPELVLPPVLQYSTDGQTYATLGPMTRIAGGWSRHGVPSPNVVGQRYYLRAEGRIGGGDFNSSQGLVESVRVAYASDRIFADGFEP